jgi:hypothetical protein
MFDIPRLHLLACSNSVQLVPLHPIIISILFHHYKELTQCISEVEQIEEATTVNSNNNKKKEMRIKEEKEKEEEAAASSIKQSFPLPHFYHPVRVFRQLWIILFPLS